MDAPASGGTHQKEDVGEIEVVSFAISTNCIVLAHPYPYPYPYPCNIGCHGPSREELSISRWMKETEFLVPFDEWFLKEDEEDKGGSLWRYNRYS
ncbi:unnamed protein product [Prunus armeniaca]|uniref:Uncharacterized protein n=1 Tax=Prunus armeniaca TaxID=36596 RepID=A0A6J5Y3W8_PRUAR|nr:unnamed protein product [Prunus armeniaca]CAB4319107.1 unnamed protein product [Prunus armeniaca]